MRLLKCFRTSGVSIARLNVLIENWNTVALMYRIGASYSFHLLLCVCVCFVRKLCLTMLARKFHQPQSSAINVFDFKAKSIS